MKLALIRRQFSATGGAELYVQRFLHALSNQGHDLHFFAEDWGDVPPDITAHRIPVHGTRATRPLRFAKAVHHQIQCETFDCVFSFERTLTQDVYRAGDGVHARWIRQRRRFAPWWKRPFTGIGAFHRNMCALERQTFSPANTRHVIVNSEMVKQEILEEFRFPEERIHLVRNGIDVDRFQNGQRASTRAKFGFKENDLVLLFVGSGAERKGLHYALKALDRLELRQGLEILGADLQEESAGVPPAIARLSPRLLVVGKDPRPAWAPDNALFAGPMKNVEDAYAAADIFILLPVYEPSANVVPEAMAAGLPVITSRFNGAAELITPGVNGTVLEDPSRPEPCVEAILHWAAHRHTMRAPDPELLRLERNVAETIRILELAASERRRQCA